MKNDKHLFLHFLDKIVDTRLTYNEIKNDEEARATSTLLGKRALIYDIVIIITVIGGAALLCWALSLLESKAVLFAIVMILLAVGMFITSLVYYIIGLNCAIKQLCLNRRAIGWIALFLPIVAAILAVAGILLFGVF